MIGIVIAVLVIGGLAVVLYGPHAAGRRRRGTRADASGGTWAVPMGDSGRDRRDGDAHLDGGADSGADAGADGGAGSDGGGGGGSDGGGGCGGGGCGGGGS